MSWAMSSPADSLLRAGGEADVSWELGWETLGSGSQELTGQGATRGQAGAGRRPKRQSTHSSLPLSGVSLHQGH